MPLAARAFVVWCVLAPLAAGAEVIYDTYPFGLSSGPDRLIGAANHSQYADPFQVPAGGRRLLERITVRLRTRLLAGPETDVAVRLRVDDAGEPGVVLEEWVVPRGNTTPSDYVLESVAEPVLEEGSVYWINIANADTSGSASWITAETNSLDWLFANSPSLFPAWQDPGPGGALTGHGFAQVEVPEPGAGPLLALGGALLAPLARLRRRSGR